MRGKIKNLKQSFGYIESPDHNKDLFFHRSDLVNSNFGSLQIGSVVEFELGQGERGVKAFRVRLVETGSVSLPANAKRFLNPYNFVRLLGEPVGGSEVERLVLGKCTPPPHDRYVGLSGRITCRLTAKSPLFVSDSHAVDNTNKHLSYRFFRYGDKFAIPASSLRGMIRSVFESVTNSCLIHLDHSKVHSKRVESRDGRTLWPVLLTRSSPGGKWSIQILNGTAAFDPKGPRNQEELPAAWVLQYRSAWNESLHKNNENYATKKYSERNFVNLNGLRHGDPCWALMESMTRPQKKSQAPFKFWNVLAITAKKESLPPQGPSQICKPGWLFIAGETIDGKHDERFFFSDENEVRSFEVRTEILDEYVNLVRDYQSRHQKDLHKPDKRLSNFIKNPDAAEEACLDGALLYASFKELDDHTIEPEYLAPVSIPRINYQRSVGRLISETGSRQVLRCECIKQLCPACRAFGWVSPTVKPESPDVAFKSRIEFSHAGHCKQIGETLKYELAILSSPKPTTTLFYLKKRDGSAMNEQDLKSGYDGDMVISGRKFYRRPKPDDLTKTHVDRDDRTYHEFEKFGGQSNDQNRTVRDVLVAGNEFLFTIDYRNLAELELGALLWAVELEPGWAHRLGYAKPLGFGDVGIKIESLVEFDMRARYQSLESQSSGLLESGAESAGEPIGSSKLDAARLEALRRNFQVALAEVYGARSFDELENVRDLAALLGPQLDRPLMHYPRSAYLPDRKGRNFKWFMANKRREQLPLPVAEEDTKGFPYFE